MRSLLTVVLVLALACMAQATPLTLVDAARLERLGFAASALEGYNLARPEASSSDKLSSVTGQLRCLLSLQRSKEVRATLSKSSELLNGSQVALYTMLSYLQEGNLSEARRQKSLVQPQALTADESAWSAFAMGMIAWCDGSRDEADAFWKSIKNANVAPYIEALGASSSASLAMVTPTDDKELDKKLARLRDWPLVKLNALALAKSGNASRALKILERQSSPQRYWVMSQIMPVGSAGRRDKILNAMSVATGPEALAVLRLALEEPTITLIELQGLWAQRRTPEMEGTLILAETWRSRADDAAAMALWEKIVPDSLDESWRASYYWTGVQLATHATPARYRQAAELLKAWGKLDTSEAQRQSLLGAMADAYFNAGDFVDAAELYEGNLPQADDAERSRRLHQSVLAYLRADKPAQAERVLRENIWGGFPQALLEYIRVQATKGVAVAEMMKPFASRGLSDAELWPIDYLRIEQLEPQKGLEALGDYLASAPATASWRIYFELLRYDRLIDARSATEAYAYLETLITRYPNHPDILKRQIEMLSARHQSIVPTLEKLALLTDLSALDRVRLLLSAAQTQRDNPVLLEEAQKSIAILSDRADRVRLTMALLRIKVQQGAPKEALAGCDTMLETPDMPQRLRDSVELLRASVLEVLGDPSAESAYMGLTQRADADIRLRSQARLAVYYMNHGQKASALDLLRTQLLAPLDTPNPAIAPEVLRDLAYAYANLYTLLPSTEADSLQKWLEAYAPKTAL